MIHDNKPSKRHNLFLKGSRAPGLKSLTEVGYMCNEDYLPDTNEDGRPNNLIESLYLLADDIYNEVFANTDVLKTCEDTWRSMSANDAIFYYKTYVIIPEGIIKCIMESNTGVSFEMADNHFIHNKSTPYPKDSDLLDFE
jgi:hypothetical protein